MPEIIDKPLNIGQLLCWLCIDVIVQLITRQSISMISGLSDISNLDINLEVRIYEHSYSAWHFDHPVTNGS